MKKSGIAAMVLGLKPKGGKSEEPDGDEKESGDDEASDYDAAADELFDALKSGDRKGFATALKAAVMACTES